MDQENLIHKWLLDDLSGKESKAFDELEDASFYKEIIEDAARFKASNFSTVDDFETFRDRFMVPDSKVKKLQWHKPILRVASVVAVVFGLYYFFLFNDVTKVNTMVAEKTTIELPDASQVVVNALSEVSFNENGWEKKREIKLEGEAFFDVAKGAKFDVVTPEGTVSVLGTEFNVKQRGTFFEVSCFEGTVKVSTGKHTTILQVGDNVKLVDGEPIMGKNSFDQPQWTQNRSYFQRTPVSEVLAELERQYDITVTTENVDTAQLFTGGFVQDNLQDALRAISEPLGLKHEILKPRMVRFSKHE
ncbi:FecR family protein [Muricauda sp. JGD-17]|uniref:FecR family protein n=1 Tax=Flagellimonas ochracea TaxID=2696472 RepID=A0A964WY31_9FLAO|nr:FecR domain-containing protein [Allomuricauda ochracea]NAY92393.1 FecR family protein [Allomuricauda ochracea]